MKSLSDLLYKLLFFYTIDSTDPEGYKQEMKNEVWKAIGPDRPWWKCRAKARNWKAE